MSFTNYPMKSKQLFGVGNCPHCGVSDPVLVKVWGEPTPRNNHTNPVYWAAYVCSTCGSLVTARGNSEAPDRARPTAIYPEIFEPDAAVPEPARRYLHQAHRTLANPDASVMVSASAIDAMLKDKELIDGTLNKRIREAVDRGILTKVMADWAHRVRLDANNPRHADGKNPHMSSEDASRAFTFARAIGDFLYVLPSQMPPEETDE